MKIVKINSLDDLDILLRVARAQFDSKGSLDVVIKNQDESITSEQWGLYFIWCGVIGADLGNTKDEQHQYFKERYLLRIFINDPVNHPEFIGVVENMKIIKERCPEQYEANRRLVINGVHLRDTTKQNMMDLLNEVDAMARELDIRLPAPPRKGML